MNLNKENNLLKYLENFYERWIHRLILTEEKSEEINIPTTKKTNYFLKFLKALPFISLLVFMISIFYDPFENIFIQMPWRKEVFSLSGLLRMLSVTGLVGYGTNYIAIKMLFHPRNKRPLLGQGLIPASKIKIAYKLGESLSREIINHELIAYQIHSSGIVKKYLNQFNQSLEKTLQMEEFQKDFIKLLEEIFNAILHSEEFKKNIKNFVKSIDFEKISGIESGLLKIYRWLGGDIEISKKIEELLLSMQINLNDNKDYILQQLHLIPEFLNKNENTLENTFINAIGFLIERINIKKIMIENLLALDELRLEKLILYSTSDQLDYIQYLGCLLGILGGLFIWLPLESFIMFFILGSLLFLIDEIIFRIQNNQNKRLKK